MKNGSSNSDEESIYTTVDDDLFEELSQLIGQAIVLAQLWDESVVETLDTSVADEAQAGSADVENPDMFDLDLYLKDGLFFELFGVTFFPSLDAEPLAGFEPIELQLTQWVKAGLTLVDIAVDEEESLVLVLGRRQPQLYLVIGAWSVREWSELPGEA